MSEVSWINTVDVKQEEAVVMAAFQVEYAYHVTNVVADYYDSPPNWKYLNTIEAGDEEFDGPLFELDLQGVFLTTTLYDFDLPTRTVYPREGLSGERYWRAQVPMTRFNNKRIIKVQEDDNNATTQVLLLLADNNYSDVIDDVLEFPEAEELTYFDQNYYLHRDRVTKKWYSNNFERRNPYWVNIFVPHRVKLGFDCVWDKVQHF